MVEGAQKPRRRRRLGAMDAQQVDLVNAVASIHTLVKALDEKLESKISRDEQEIATIREAITKLHPTSPRLSSLQSVEGLQA